MLALKLLLCSAVMTAFLLQGGDAGWFRLRIRWRRVIRVVVKCYLAGCFSKNQMDQLCQGVSKATIKREEWQAVDPRHVSRTEEISAELILRHTGPDTCQLIGLSGFRCQQCIQNDSCMRKHIFAFQDADLRDGMDDIKYHFLIGQDGVIYEGRGWRVAGPETDHQNAVSIAMIGDFNKSEPSEAALNALKKLITCGQSAGALSRDFDVSTTPEISGQALFDMIKRCNGLCVDE